MLFILNCNRINNRYFILHYSISKKYGEASQQIAHTLSKELCRVRATDNPYGDHLPPSGECFNAETMHMHYPIIPFKCKKETHNADQQTAVYFSLR